MPFYVQKYSGETEPFNIKKFTASLKRAGASKALIDQLVLEITQLPLLRTTKEIYEFALARLHKKNPVIAARYNIKQALLDFGPSGFPFEKYVAEVFKAQDYATKTHTVVRGFCVDHEVDVIAVKGNEHCMIECKFHNEQGLICNVKVPLYIKARFDDVLKTWKNYGDTHTTHRAMIVTNTRFSAQAVAYAQCVGVGLLGWGYPEGASLVSLIDRFGLHPITALVSLTHRQKKLLIEQGLTLCRDVQEHAAALDALNLSEQDTEHLMQEMKAVCSIKS
jgi:hypothetical protein